MQGKNIILCVEDDKLQQKNEQLQNKICKLSEELDLNINGQRNFNNKKIIGEYDGH